MHIKIKFFLYSLIIASGLAHNYSYTMAESGTIGLGVSKVVAVVKATAITVVAAPATPYILAGAATGLVVGVGYNIYQSSNPDPKGLVQAEKRNAEIAKYQEQTECHKAEAEHHKAAAMYAQRQQQILKTEADFKQCVSNSVETAEIPSSCKELASAYALIAGYGAVDEVVESLKRYPKP
jgi:hypothetical protein